MRLGFQNQGVQGLGADGVGKTHLGFTLKGQGVGGAAVKAADEGDSGKMVVIERFSDDPYQSGTEVKDVHKIANGEKLVPRNWVNQEGTYVTEEFITYVKPLIQGDVSPVMVDGIPRHLYRPF